MDKELLKWGLTHSDATSLSEAAVKAQNVHELDPELIDFILGKSETEQIKECGQVIADVNPNNLERRVAALEVLEMHVESLDNAKSNHMASLLKEIIHLAVDMESLRLWPTILSCLQDPNEAIRKGALWVIGTSAQNNSSVQKALLSHDCIEKVLSSLKREECIQVKLKGVYCISSVVKQSNEQYHRFVTNHGLDVLSNLLRKTKDEQADEIDENNSMLEYRIKFFLVALFHEHVELAQELKERYPALERVVNQNFE